MDFFLSLAKHDLYFRVHVVKCRMIVDSSTTIFLLGPTFVAAPAAQSQIDLRGSTEEWTAVSQTKVPHRQ